ncbi:phosphate/phosphite/phosphonate ABC transporter substrate-binding protein [Grimontia kaedaensis]|uniref:Phosphate/phosphite/phosphonate ABC transporter substrate-binding protein n=1 Tax=Grimontia kaedaensis TaxID=2872157 RepID=A0ABY4X1E1_9GAMM|nr:phosphate/phosphite/phosphonate ABC transporter substrate-binding protein [Grimontia kaedaensis]USH05048.1 phosphate/phosphite/phosphonate ABC transporter substrate-binding protein [Grimontia kaedaensis]
MRSIGNWTLHKLAITSVVILCSGFLFTTVNVHAHAGKHADDSHPLVFGIVPQQSSAKLIRNWSPVMKTISELSGLKIRFATAPNIPEFEKRLAEGQYDIAYMNPYHFTVFNESPGYKAVAHAKNKRIKGILVVRESSPVKTLEELDGKSLAFPAPAAFAATLLTQATLKNKGIQFEPNYVGSHDSSYLGVADGLFEAGGGIVRTLGAAPPNAKDNLKVLYTTEGYTPHAIATHPSLSADQHRRLRAAFVALDGSPEGKEALKKLNIKGFQSADDDAWDDIRALNISVIQPK